MSTKTWIVYSYLLTSGVVLVSSCRIELGSLRDDCEGAPCMGGSTGGIEERGEKRSRPSTVLQPKEKAPNEEDPGESDETVDDGRSGGEAQSGGGGKVEQTGGSDSMRPGGVAGAPTNSPEDEYPESPGCDNDARALTAHHRSAVGRLLLPDDEWCTATIIAPDKILTAASCVEEYMPQDLSFEITAWQGEDPPQLQATRITQGRDAGSATPHSNWAIVSFSPDTFQILLGDDFRPMVRKSPTFEAETFEVHVLGFDGDLLSKDALAQALVVDRQCDWLTIPPSKERTPWTDCAAAPGGAGAPHFLSIEGTGQILGVATLNETQSVCAPNFSENVVSGKWFAAAPDFAAGIAAVDRRGVVEVYATDPHWSSISFRSFDDPHSPSGWSEWKPFENVFADSSKIAASLLADGRISIYAIRAGNLMIRWELGAPVYWSHWQHWPTPGTIVDVATTGQTGVRTHMFVLGSEGSVWESHKLGDASSYWSDWSLLGTHSGAVALSGVHFDEHHDLAPVGPDGARLAHGDQENFSSLASIGTENLTAVALSAASPHVLGILTANDSGVIQGQFFAPGLVPYTDWLKLLALTPTRVATFRSLATVTTRGGIVKLFGIGSDANIYSAEVDTTGLSLSGWSRFYD